MFYNMFHETMFLFQNTQSISQKSHFILKETIFHKSSYTFGKSFDKPSTHILTDMVNNVLQTAFFMALVNNPEMTVTGASNSIT